VLNCVRTALRGRYYVYLLQRLSAIAIKRRYYYYYYSVSKIKQSPTIFTRGMFIIQCSIQWGGYAYFALQSLSKHGGMRDEHTRMSCLMSSLAHCRILNSDVAVTSSSVSKKYYQDMGQRLTAQVVSKRRLV